MKKSPLIGISIVVACLILLASFTNVVGVQNIESSKKNVIKDEVDPKELLFQMILDIANNKEIQNILYNYESTEGLVKSLRTPSAMPLLIKLRMRFIMLLPPPQVLTKNYLRYVYITGVRLSRNLDISWINSILERYQMSNQEIQKEITAAIEKNDVLQKRISSLSCECEDDKTTPWSFPIICLFLFPIFFISFGLYVRYNLFPNFFAIMLFIWSTLNCFT